MSYKFFQNKSCEFFPCKKAKYLNCLFCYCPLYYYENCGGKYTILKNDIKDCSKCLLPHSKNRYNYIIKFIKEKSKWKYFKYIKHIENGNRIFRYKNIINSYYVNLEEYKNNEWIKMDHKYSNVCEEDIPITQLELLKLL